MKINTFSHNKESNFNNQHKLGKRNKLSKALDNDMSCCTYQLISTKKKVKKDCPRECGYTYDCSNKLEVLPAQSFNQKYIKQSDLEKAISDKVLN